ncbi:MAG: hypothetical protein Q9172_006804 [Xanthocarpia lactea]
MGYVGWIGGNLGVKEEQTHQVESLLVKELLSLGAVLYCKSSLPQTLLNPGQNTYRSTVGLMSTSLEGLEITFRSLLSSKPWLHDPAVVPIPWRQDIIDVTNQRFASRSRTESRPLKLGILWNDSVVEPHPPVRRGLSIVVDAVRNAGHTVVDWSPPKQTTAKRVHVSFLFADGAHDVHTQLRRSGEPLIPELKKSFQLRDPIPLLEYQDLTLQGLDYEREYCDYWNSTSTDEAYTEAINLLNYSVVVIPVTRANKDIDLVDNTYSPISEADRKNWEACKWKYLIGGLDERSNNAPIVDDPEMYDGGPVGVQIVARKFEEEKVLAIAKHIHSALNIGNPR